MIWLAWRQFRAAAAAMGAALLLLGAALAATGPGLAGEAAAGQAACASSAATAPGGGPARAGDTCTAFGQEFFDNYAMAFFASVGGLWLLPALVAMFVGAPLVARELEAGTHRLVWSQGITRMRWLAAKLGVVGPITLAAVGLASLAVTWWAVPVDTAAQDFALMGPFLFAARGILPVGYAALALILGVALGTLLRRTVPAMLATLVVLAIVQVAVPSLVRPHLVDPVQATYEITDDNPDGFTLTRVGPDRVSFSAGDTGAWILDSRTVDASGEAVAAMEVDPDGHCVRPEGADRASCFAEMTERGYRQQVAYLPADRFWTLQAIETGLVAALALALAGFCFWRIRRNVS